MATPAAAAAASAPATLTKVFVGNLSFKTREAELAQAFSGAGKVLNANIITRGPRSLGYGFVEFGNEAEAKKAVELLNKKELDGREINVEVAKPREDGERAEGPKASGAPRRGGAAGGGRGPRNASGAGGAAAGGAAPAGNNNNNGGGRRNNNQNAAGGAPAPAGGAQRSGDYIPRRRPGFRRGGGQNAGAGGAPRQGNAGGQGAGANAGAAASAPRTSSATTLFVANLPFAVDDKNLEDLFKDFAPVSAHVVKKRNGKSKGFGFVELKNSEDQAKALAAMDKKEVQGRELIVKIALTEQMAKEQAAAAAPAPAPAAASPAPAAAKASPATDKKQ